MNVKKVQDKFDAIDEVVLVDRPFVVGDKSGFSEEFVLGMARVLGVVMG